MFQTYEVIHCLVESTLNGMLYFILHVMPFINCGYGRREMMKKLRHSLKSAFWKVRIDSAFMVYPRDHSVPVFSVNSCWYHISSLDLGKNWQVWCLFSSLCARCPVSGLIWVYTKSNLIRLDNLLHRSGEIITREG